MDIYLAASWLSKYPPLTTSSEKLVRDLRSKNFAVVAGINHLLWYYLTVLVYATTTVHLSVGG